MWMAELQAVTLSGAAILRPTRRDALADAARSALAATSGPTGAEFDGLWAAYEHERARHRWTDHVELPLARLVSESAHGVEPASLERAISARLADSLEWQADALPVLDYLHESGYRTALLLDLPVPMPGAWRERASPWIDEFVSTSEVLRRTPDGAPFQEALRRLHAPPAKALHVGEGLVEDVHAAGTLHLRTALLERFGRTPQDPEAAEWLRRVRQMDTSSIVPDLKLRTLEDLPRALDAFG